MDDSELERLRQKYGQGHGGDIFDPRFKRVADKIFNAAGTRALPYGGVPTLLSAPFRPIAAENPDFGDIQVALYGVPMDLGVTNRSGSRFGPRALRTIERIGPYNHVLDCMPVGDLRVADIGDVPFRSRYKLGAVMRHRSLCLDARRAGVVPLGVGGDHSISHPILKAIGRDRPVGMVHIDAHCDTGGEFDETKFHHGGPFRQAVLDGVLDPSAPSRSGSAAPPNIFGSSPMIPA